MNKAQKITLGILAIVILFLASIVVVLKLSVSNSSLPLQGGRTATAADNLGWTVTTTYSDASSTVPTLVSDTRQVRYYELLVNDSTSVMYINLGPTSTAANNQGIRLNAGGGSFEINPDNAYFGQISVATSTGRLLIVEKYR